MSNPGGLNLNSSPYFDDFDEDKKFVRILFRPGRAVQARELTQLQSILQKQIQRFGSYFFKEGGIIDGCEQSLDLNLPYVKLQTNYQETEVDVDTFLNKKIVGVNTGVTATVGFVADAENDDPKTLFVNYLSSGTYVLNVNVVPGTLVAGNTFTTNTGYGTIEYWNIDLSTLYLSNVVGTIDTANSIVGYTLDSIGANLSMTILDGSDSRSIKEFEDGETLFAANTTIVYANTAISNATRYVDFDTGTVYTSGSKVTIGDGVLYVSDHFIKHSSQTIILDKYRNIPTYKVGVIPTKTFVDYIDDVSLVDNAQGTPNFQAPGADRFKIETVLTKFDPNESISETEFVTLMDIEDGQVKKKKSFGLESKLEEVISRRTYEESGDYTLTNPKLNVREHLLENNNNGRYSASEGGNTNLLLLEVDPFISYVKGFRNEFITKSNVVIEKGLDTQFVNQNKTQINIGNYVEVNELVGSWDIMQATKVDLYDTAFNSITNSTFSSTTTSGTKIGEARVRGIEYITGDNGTAAAKYRLYLFDIVMNSGSLFQNVRTIYDAATPNRIANIVLNSLGNATLFESAYNNALFELPYTSVKSLRDEDGVVQSEFTFKKEFDVTFTSGLATLSSGDNNESFVGTGVLSSTQKNENYSVVVSNSGANVETTSLSGTVTIGVGSNTVVGTSTAFSTELNVGDIIKVNSLSKKIQSISNAQHLILTSTHATGATANSYTKILSPGIHLDLSANGGVGATRTVNALSPSTIQIDLKEDATFTAKIITTLNRTSAKEMRKVLQPNATVNINANTHPNSFSGPYSIGKSDVYQIREVYQSLDFDTAANTSSDIVTSNYDFDNGQRDNTYEHATITPKLGATITGQLLVVFDYFTHDTTQGVGYLSVDSYPVNDTASSNTTIKTSEIPKYLSKTTGIVYDLRNCIDFRLRKNDSVAATNPSDPSTYQIPIGGLHIPKQYSDFDADLSIYKGRISKLFLNENGEFGILDGSPGYPIPQTPASVPGTLDLAVIEVPPYPSSPVDVVIEPQKNRRYTMKDIGRIEDRVNRLEYYTSLNMLEKQAADIAIFDENGLDRFKNGILVDPFIGHNVADVNNADLKASIDTKEKFATAQATLAEMPMSYSANSSSGVIRTAGNKIMLPYTEQVFSENLFASSAINLAQKLSYDWTGVITLYPSTDNWMDTVNYPTKNLVVVDLQGNADNWRVISNAWDTEYNSWESRWIGVPVQQDAGTTKSTVNRIFNSSTQADLIGSSITVGPTETQTQARVVDVSVNHFMRQRDYIFSASGMKELTQLYAFFDGVDVTANCVQIELETGKTINDVFDLFSSNGAIEYSSTVYTVKSANTLYVDSDGEILGIFSLPDQKFNIGQREFKLSDSSTNSDDVATTVSKNNVISQGISLITTTTQTNTRPINVNFAAAIEKSNVTRQVNSVANQKVSPRDPLSQSFYIDEINYPYGVFTTKIEVFFKSKSEDPTRKVYMQIREMENGFPTRKAIGDSTTYMTSENITVSADGTESTLFTFDNPIFLLPGVDYCFSLIPEGNSDEFEIWIAEMGEIDVSGGDILRRIEKQPAAGVLFTPSNNFSWSVRQTQDVKYRVHIANFTPNQTGTVVLQNKNVAVEKTYSKFIPNVATLTPDKTSVLYSTSVSNDSGTLTGYFSVNNLEKIDLIESKTILTSLDEANNDIKSINVSGVMKTENKFITPFIDLERINVITHDFAINNLTSNTLTGTATYDTSSPYVTGSGTSFDTELSIGQYVSFGGVIKRINSVVSSSNVGVNGLFTSNASLVTMTIGNEENPVGPYTAESRYITRRVELADGFEANDLIVYLDVNRPAGTDIKVYYKILSQNDSDNFDDKMYTEMELDGNAISTSNRDVYSTEKYISPVSARSGGTLLLTGVLSVGTSTTVVNGTGTRFFEELRIGDTVRVNSTERVVTDITSNQQLTVDSPYGFTSSTAIGYKILNNSITYITPDNRTYSGYKYLALKVVFLSDNKSVSSRIKKLKAISIT